MDILPDSQSDISNAIFIISGFGNYGAPEIYASNCFCIASNFGGNFRVKVAGILGRQTKFGYVLNGTDKELWVYCASGYVTQSHVEKLSKLNNAPVFQGIAPDGLVEVTPVTT